jgi:DNA-binding NarL/FixJ family response regulator
LARLTTGQRDSLRMRKAGMSSRAIARVLGISQPMVIKHIRNAKAKLSGKSVPHNWPESPQRETISIDNWDAVEHKILAAI